MEDYITPEEYLISEVASDRRHEYVAGTMHGLPDANIGHARIRGRILSELSRQLKSRRCEAFTFGIKVRIENGSECFYYYPDIIVDCGQPSGESLFAEEPRVIFEVLSPSTERTDRYEKRLNYQKLATLDVYVLVDQARVAVTAYRRADADTWTAEFLRDPQAVLDLPTVGCALPLAAIYERTLLVR